MIQRMFKAEKLVKIAQILSWSHLCLRFLEYWEKIILVKSLQTVYRQKLTKNAKYCCFCKNFGLCNNSAKVNKNINTQYFQNKTKVKKPRQKWEKIRLFNGFWTLLWEENILPKKSMCILLFYCKIFTTAVTHIRIIGWNHDPTLIILWRMQTGVGKNGETIGIVFKL